jgi:nitroreductase
MNTTIQLLKSHRSIRKFKAKPVDAESIRAIIEAAQCAATSNHVQAYTVIRVTDKNVREKIAELSGPQPWVALAPLFMVFCADLNRLEKACEMHGRKMARGLAEQFVVATVDTALMAQNAMIAAESLGLGGVFIGGIRNDPQKVCDLLHIPPKAYPVFGMCLGYPDQDPPVKPRMPIEIVYKRDRYDANDLDRLLQIYDRKMNAYYKSRNTNLKNETWSRQMAEFMQKKIRPHMRAFLQSRGFFTH